MNYPFIKLTKLTFPSAELFPNFDDPFQNPGNDGSVPSPTGRSFPALKLTASNLSDVKPKRLKLFRIIVGLQVLAAILLLGFSGDCYHIAGKLVLSLVLLFMHKLVASIIVVAEEYIKRITSEITF